MALAGSGTAADPYQVWTALDLNEVRNKLSAYYIQMADIDLAGWNWTPIGGGNTTSDRFTGTYDGNGKQVKNLSIDVTGGSTAYYLGLFGFIYTNAEVKNLAITANIKALDVNYAANIGAVAGRADSATIQNCTATTTIQARNRDALLNCLGGIVGYLGGTQIKQCKASVSIEGLAPASGYNGNAAGGIAGYSPSATGAVIEGCCASGTIAVASSDRAPYAGGIVSYLRGTVKNCYSSVSVSVTKTGSYVTSQWAGGIVGQLLYGTCQNCYAIGAISVSSGTNKGGVVGQNSGGTVTASYYNSDTTGCTDTGKGDPKTTAQLKMQSTYIGWDFELVWAINPGLNNGYPYLRWEGLVPPPPPDEVPPSYAPQSTIKLEFSAGDSASYPMGTYYADKTQYKVGNASTKIDARNGIGKYLKDQTFDEKCKYQSQKVSDMLEAILSSAGLTKFYVQPSTIYMGMDFAPNKDILGGIEEILQYLSTWQIREEVDGTVVVASSTDSHFTQPSRYTFQRDRDIFSREVVTDDRSIYGRVCVHTSDFTVRVYRPITSDLGWIPPAQKTLYQPVPDGTTSLEAATIATNLAASMANSGKIETFVCPFRPQIIPGDEAEILENSGSKLLGVITQVKHSFGVGGFMTEIVVDSGGRIGKPNFRELISGLKPLPTSKKVS